MSKWKVYIQVVASCRNDEHLGGNTYIGPFASETKADAWLFRQHDAINAYNELLYRLYQEPDSFEVVKLRDVPHPLQSAHEATENYKDYLAYEEEVSSK